MKVLSMSKKDKSKNLYQDEQYGARNIINIFACNIFDYDTPDNLDKWQIERALQSGVCALYKCDVLSSVNYNRWCCTPAYPAGVIDNNGIARKITTSGSDYALELDVNKDCILLYNTSTKMPNDILDKYASLINEIDKTIYTIVKWSRLVPIPKVYNDDDIIKYKVVMDKVMDGDLINAISDNTMLLKPDTASSKNDDMLNLTDVNAADKLHFLSELREEVIKRLATLYGIPFNTTAKSAQALNAELHGMDMYALYNIMDMYNARKESFDRARSFTGHDFNFRFSDLMQHQIDDILNHGDDNNANQGTQDTADT